MASVSISKNTGRVRVFMDTVAAGVVRDANGDFAVFKAHGSDFIDVRTGEIYAGGASAYLLDTYSAFAAYSVRQLKSTATNSMRVRRSSDDAETDIGFSGGWLDETALLAHCGAGNGFVTTWYDQSGNAKDASQATAGNQPQIVSSGSVLLGNTKPALDHRIGATTAWVDTATFASQAQPFTLFGVGSFENLTVSKFCDDTGAGDLSMVRFSSDGGYYIAGGSALAQGTVVPYAQKLCSALLSSTSSVGRVNGVGGTPGDAGSNSITGIRIGCGLTTQYMEYTQELIVFAADQSANFATIESNINTAFSIY